MTAPGAALALGAVTERDLTHGHCRRHCIVSEFSRSRRRCASSREEMKNRRVSPNRFSGPCPPAACPLSSLQRCTKMSCPAPCASTKERFHSFTQSVTNTEQWQGSSSGLALPSVAVNNLSSASLASCCFLKRPWSSPLWSKSSARRFTRMLSTPSKRCTLSVRRWVLRSLPGTLRTRYAVGEDM